MNTFVSFKAKVLAGFVLLVAFAGGMYMLQGDVEVVRANPGTDIFLQIGTIEGESEDPAHEDEIDVLSWSWGMSKSGPSAGPSSAKAAKAEIEDLQIKKFVDKATPILMRAYATGENISEAKLTLRRSADQPLEYLIITMEDVSVTSILVGGGASEDVMTETLTLNFKQVKVEYTEQNDDGSPGVKVQFHWDIEGGEVF